MHVLSDFKYFFETGSHYMTLNTLEFATQIKHILNLTENHLVLPLDFWD